MTHSPVWATLAEKAVYAARAMVSVLEHVIPQTRLHYREAVPCPSPHRQGLNLLAGNTHWVCILCMKYNERDAFTN